MTEELIKKINALCPENQGIFKEGWCIPNDIKEQCIYTRWETGGYKGGSYHEDDYAHPYTVEAPADRYKVLDLILAELCPNITYLQYKEIDKLWNDSDYSENEYYGNSTDWQIEFMRLSVLEDYINSLNPTNNGK